MKRPILSMLLSVLLLLPGCTQAPSGSSQEEGLTVLATTYPVYLFARHSQNIYFMITKIALVH